MNTFGKNVKISLFGEIYGKTIGLSIDGLPPSYPVNIDKVRKELEEYYLKDKNIFKYDISDFSILSGIHKSTTNGAPVVITIKPKIECNDFIDGTVIPDIFDYTTYQKYYGAQNKKETCFIHHQLFKLLIIGGMIIKQILNTYKINTISRIYTLKNIKDEEIDYSTITYSQLVAQMDDLYPMINRRASSAAVGELKKAKLLNESLGGIVETFIFDAPSLLGEPLFDGFESTLSKLLFSIPYIRGITFGDITNDIKKNGSKTIDEVQYQTNELIITSNHQGGCSCGITNGNMIYFKTYIKAPSNIPKNINSINVQTKENIEISTTTDYNTTYLFDAMYIVEALSYIVILDLLIEKNKTKEV